MTIRAIRRAIALASVLALCIPRLWFYRLRGSLTLERRAAWACATGRQMMAAMGIRARVSGELPQHGLLVSNHLGYLDILIYAAITPCFFVSKSEISRWPFFGWMSRAAGTVYVERSGRASVEEVLMQMAERLALPALVLFFPEGTSTDGSSIRPFRSRLFTPAIDAGASITAAAIRYVTEDRVAESELCWFGDAGFLPHLWKTLGRPGVTAEISFGVPKLYPDRRTAAATARAEVAQFRERAVLTQAREPEKWESTRTPQTGRSAQSLG